MNHFWRGHVGRSRFGHLAMVILIEAMPPRTFLIVDCRLKICFEFGVLGFELGFTLR